LIEPRNKILGYKKTKAAYLPTKTLVLDLRKSEEEILRGMRKETRRTINKYQITSKLAPSASNVKLLKSENAEEFRRKWKRAVVWRRYVMSERDLFALKKNFGKKAFID
jgi:hypothetical protein